jgi:hypothetical protein
MSTQRLATSSRSSRKRVSKGWHSSRSNLKQQGLVKGRALEAGRLLTLLLLPVLWKRPSRRALLRMVSLDVTLLA